MNWTKQQTNLTEHYLKCCLICSGMLKSVINMIWINNDCFIKFPIISIRMQNNMTVFVIACTSSESIYSQKSYRFPLLHHLPCHLQQFPRILFSRTRNINRVLFLKYLWNILYKEHYLTWTVLAWEFPLKSGLFFLISILFLL